MACRATMAGYVGGFALIIAGGPFSLLGVGAIIVWQISSTALVECGGTAG